MPPVWTYSNFKGRRNASEAVLRLHTSGNVSPLDSDLLNLDPEAIQLKLEDNSFGFNSQYIPIVLNLNPYPLPSSMNHPNATPVTFQKSRNLDIPPVIFDHGYWLKTGDPLASWSLIRYFPKIPRRRDRPPAIRTFLTGDIETGMIDIPTKIMAHVRLTSCRFIG
jgi:hypothetical protein